MVLSAILFLFLSLVVLISVVCLTEKLAKDGRTKLLVVVITLSIISILVLTAWVNQVAVSLL